MGLGPSPIHTAAELISELLQKNHEQIKDLKLHHGSMIGTAHEGTLKLALDRFTPTKRPLVICGGVLQDKNGKRSRQIDCMIALDKGIEIPGSNDRVMPLDDVLAIIEVKTNLYARDLEDGYVNVKSVSSLEPGKDSPTFILFRDAFRLITGLEVPDRPAHLPCNLEPIYHFLLLEAVLPARIILGFSGYTTEKEFRRAFVAMVEKEVGTTNSGVLGLPSLIMSPITTICKFNGMPWGHPIINGFMKFIGSDSSRNPLLALLEIVWTRLSYRNLLKEGALFGNTYGDSWNSLLDVQPVISNGEVKGWHCEAHDKAIISQSYISAAPSWSPIELTTYQAGIIDMLSHGKEIFEDNLGRFAGNHVDAMRADLETLVTSKLVLKKYKENRIQYVLHLDTCVIVITPQGQIYCADSNDERFMQWHEGIFKIMHLNKGIS